MQTDDLPPLPSFSEMEQEVYVRSRCFISLPIHEAICDLMQAYARTHAAALQAENDKLLADVARLAEALDDLFGAGMERCMRGDGHDDQIEAIEKAKAARASITGDKE